MIKKPENLEQWLVDIATSIEHSENPEPKPFNQFMQQPELALELIALIAKLDENQIEEESAYYSACILALEICVAQLQSASESGNKLALKTLNQLMFDMATAIGQHEHSLGFWLPILNAFYEAQVTLSEPLQDAYFELALYEEVASPEEELAHLDSIRDLIDELSDLSVFDIAENFFAQSYAMPADFFADLLVDLYSIEEGQEIGILTLLHPKQEVRDVVVSIFDELIDKITLSPSALTRLKTIKQWYPKSYHVQFDRWIKKQRKKGVVFHHVTGTALKTIKASEVDGTGAQGIFVQIKCNRKKHLCGLLLKQDVGIKDAWVTPVLTESELKRYYNESSEDGVTLRVIDDDYIVLMVNHFLAVTIEQGNMPDLHLLQIQEELGVQFLPQRLDVDQCMQQLAVQITPFTPEVVQTSLKRSKSWTKNKRFTESWYVENARIDKWVNRNCSFVDGVKVCHFDDAMEAVFEKEMELNREKWVFHFLWTALWLKAKQKMNEKLWQDCFFIAHVIHTGQPLASIPIMREICHQTVMNSMETMHERRTHLN